MMPYTDLDVIESGLPINMVTDSRFIASLSPTSAPFRLGERGPGEIELIWQISTFTGETFWVDVYAVEVASTFTSLREDLPQETATSVRVVSDTFMIGEVTHYVYSVFSKSQIPDGVSIFGSGELPKIQFSNDDGSGGTGLTIGQILSSGVPDLLSGVELYLEGTNSNDTLVMPAGQAGELRGDVGDDLLRGGELDDRLYGDNEPREVDLPAGKDTLVAGGGDDTLYGALNDDWMYGDEGADFFDQSGGWGDGNDHIFGGNSVDSLTPAFDVDTVHYSGQRSDYTFVDRPVTGVTLVRNRLTGDIDTLVGTEHIVFDDLTATNQLNYPSDIMAMALQSVFAYSEKIYTNQGWKAVHANEMALPTTSEGTGLRHDWTFQNGVFRVKSGILSSIFDTDAVAHVSFGRGDDGNITLNVSFRGTDDTSTDRVDGWGPWMDDYYELFRPLIEGIRTYISDYPVSKVLVSGHSLGGAMAQYFMREFADTTKTDFLCATFGSPGAADSASVFDDRIIQFEHSEDLVPLTAIVTGFPKHGTIIHVPIDDLLTPDDDGVGTYEHDKNFYFQSVQNFWTLGAERPGFLTDWSFDDQQNIYAVAGSRFADSIAGSNLNETVWGGDRNDVLFGLGNDDDIFGGSGRDILVGGKGTDFLDGGPGADVFQFDDNDSRPGRGVADLVSNFQVAEDLVSLALVDADATLADDQAFVLIGSAAFSGVAGELRIVSAANTRIEGNMDGDLQPEFVLVLLGGTHLLTAANFLL